MKYRGELFFEFISMSKNVNRSCVYETIGIGYVCSFLVALTDDLILIAIPVKIIKYVKVDMVHFTMFSPEPTETSVSEMVFEST